MEPLAERALTSTNNVHRDNKLLRDYTDERFYQELGLSKTLVDNLLGRSLSFEVHDNQPGYYPPEADEVITLHKELIGLYYRWQYLATKIEDGAHHLSLLHEKIDKLWVYYQSDGAIGFEQFESVGDYVIEGQDAQFGVYASKGYEWILLAGLVCYTFKKRQSEVEGLLKKQEILMKMPKEWLDEMYYSQDREFRDWVTAVNQNWDQFVYSFTSETRILLTASLGKQGELGSGAGATPVRFLDDITRLDFVLNELDPEVKTYVFGGRGYTPKSIEHYALDTSAKQLYEDSRIEVKAFYRFQNEEIPYEGVRNLPEWMLIGNDRLLKELGAPSYQ